MSSVPTTPASRPDALTDQPKNLFEHIAELRGCVLRALLGLVVGMAIALPFQERLLTLLVFPARSSLSHLTYLSPAEPFVTQLKLALVAGLLLALPYVVWQLWKFVAPALYPTEQRWAVRLSGFSLGLFWFGVLFAYGVAIPFTMRFFQQYQTEFLFDNITMHNYVNFALGMLVAFGAAFQLPLVLLFLMRTGLVPRARMVHNRRIVIVIILIAAAVFTPADIISMFVMAVPLYALFEIALIAERMIQQRAAQRQEPA
jgi:sec-independent protein translocase protein TatC